MYYQQCYKKWITITYIKNKQLKAHALYLHDFVVWLFWYARIEIIKPYLVWAKALVRGVLANF